MPVSAMFFLPPLVKIGAHEWTKGDSRPLVEDGCRSVISEGGPEVDLQGTVTVGRGGVGQGTVTVRLNTSTKFREIHGQLCNHTQRNLPS